MFRLAALALGMHAGVIENAACVRVAELPEPVKNQRSQHGLPCGARFFAGSADVSLGSIGSGDACRYD